MDKNVSYQLLAISGKPKDKCQRTKGSKVFLNRFSLSIIALLSTFFSKAQDSIAKKDVVEMATTMRSNGKIYVVVAVLCIILTGIFLYLINLDKKISKLEQETNSIK
jgi:CcmD family protein